MKRLLLLLAFILPVLGNDTTIDGGGYDPEPVGEFEGNESVIRLISETIEIRFSREESLVCCRFTFRSEKENGNARQFLGFMDLLLDSFQEHKPIRDVETFIDGEKVEIKKERGWIGDERRGLGMPPGNTEAEIGDLFVAEANFPPDKNVIVERKFICRNSGDRNGAAVFDYLTSSSAAWKGNIAQADFHILLDGLTVDDLAFEDGEQKNPSRSQHFWCKPNLSQWRVISPIELKMTWRDFEPAVHNTRAGIRLATWAKPPADKK